ncbi:MAG: hypothetical protein MI867_29885, partial [Pseudomonadales bacterium]|nr:hypothetical protein [Pseudomonadales bacterium]
MDEDRCNTGLPAPDLVYDPYCGKTFERPKPISYWEEHDTQRGMSCTTVRAWSDMYPTNYYFMKLR